MRSVRFGLWLGIIGLVGCDGIQKVAQDGPLSCHSDDDCAALPMQKACHAGFCADPGCPLGTAYVGPGRTAAAVIRSIPTVSLAHSRFTP